MILIYIMERDVEAYRSQGWIVTRLVGLHGARRNGRNFMAVLHE